MSDFTVFVPSGKKAAEAGKTLKKIASLYKEVLGSTGDETINKNGASVLIIKNGSLQPAFYSDERGFVVVKGLIYDVKEIDPRVDLKKLLDEFASGGEPDFNRYEGAFALVARDAVNDKTYVLNDQASLLNLYYGEKDGGLWVTTRTLPLAKALSLELDKNGVKEFIARGIVLAPNTVFKGFKRLHLGEYALYQSGKLCVNRCWLSYVEPMKFDSMDEAVSLLASKIVDTMRRCAQLRQPAVADLTGGYDTRLLACAAEFGRIPLDFTVTGEDEDVDVQIAKEIAADYNYNLIHCYRQKYLDVPADEAMRRKLLYLTGNDFVFINVYVQSFLRERLRHTYGLHFNGVGGETIRYYNWGQEFQNIGKRRLANVDNALRYRFNYDGPPPKGLYDVDWFGGAMARLRAGIEEICKQVPDSLNTQQLDAVFNWKMTGHSSLYGSSLSWYMPSSVPLMQAQTLNVTLGIPWRYRVTSLFQRKINYILSPKLAMYRVPYGSTAAPVKAKTLHRDAMQLAERGAHLLEKIDKIALKGKAKAAIAGPEPKKPIKKAFLNPEFRAMMTPENMKSRGIYNKDGLRAFCGQTDEEIMAKENFYLKAANFEILCREMGIEPDASLLKED